MESRQFLCIDYKGPETWDIPRDEWGNLAYGSGFTDMVSLAKRRVMMGQTTATEVLRVVGDGPAAEPVGA